MKKDERDVLTRKIILDKLIYEAKRSMIGSLLSFGLGAVTLGAFSLILLTLSYVTIGTKVIVGLMISIYFAICAFFFTRAFFRLINAKRGKYTVVEDILTEINDNQLNILQLLLHGGWHTLVGNKAHLNHIFKFKSGKMFIANAEEYKNTKLGTATEFSLPSDTFFLVFYNDNPNKIILLFNSKIYTYKNEK